MEIDMVEFWKTKVKPTWKLAFCSTMVIGLLTHGYKFTNTLFVPDSLRNFYSDQNILGSGRWFLSIACGLSSYFDLPWLNGVLSIFYIALTMVVITELLQLQGG